MLHSKLTLVEKAMQKGDNGNFKLEPFTIPIPGETTKLEGYTIRPSDGYDGYYYNETIPKEKIVLHFTAGHLRGDITSLMFKDRGHVSVPFVIARDGTIYQLFSSGAWSYHLGRKAIGGNGSQSKKSIGIEMSNYGPLTMVEGKLETIYSRMKNPVSGKVGKKDVYCTKQDKDLYVKLDSPYRGEQYFATYTDAQYNSLILLLRYLTAQYEIPREFLDESIRYDATEAVVDFKGIVTHANYRISGKWDIGPAFDWDKVIGGLSADSFTEESKIQMAIEAEKAKLKTARRALTQAQNKVDAILQKITELEETPPQIAASRSLGGFSKLNSEKAIEKALPKKKKTKGVDHYNGEGPNEDNGMAQFYM